MTEPKAVLAYETPTTDWSEAWRLLRLAVILWSSIVLVRHALYWSGALANVFVPSRFLIGFIGAAIESCLLIAGLIVALRAKRGAVSVLRQIAIGFVAVILVEIIVDDVLRQGLSRLADPGRLLTLLWQIVSRVQVLIVPVLCIAYGRRR